MKFRPVFINARDLDDAWHQLLYQLYKEGRRYSITSGSHAGSERVTFDFASGFIRYPQSRPLSPRMPEGVSLPPPTTDDEIDQYFANYIMDSNLEPNEEYRYATWIVGDNTNYIYGDENLCSYNQTEWVINHFKTHGIGNEHCYITIGNPDSNRAYDRPYLKCKTCGKLHTKKASNNVCTNNKCKAYGTESLFISEADRGTSPCLRGLDFRIIDGYLTTNVIYRCLDGDTPIIIKHNSVLKRTIIKEIYQYIKCGDSVEVISFDKDYNQIWSNVTDSQVSYRSDIREIEIYGGYKINASENHRFPILKNDNIELKYVYDLVDGDVLLEPYSIDFQYNSVDVIDLFEIFKDSNKVKVCNLELSDFHRFKEDNISYTDSNRDIKMISIKQAYNSHLYNESNLTIHCFKIQTNRMFKISNDFSYFMGLWCADGWYGNNSSSLRIAINSKKTDTFNRVINFLKNEFDYTPSIEHRDGCEVLNISIGFLVRMYKNLGFKHGAKSKKVPNIVFSLSNELINSFLDGWISGDTCCSASNDLIIDMSYLSKMVNKNVSIYREPERLVYFRKDNRYIKSSGCFSIYNMSKNRPKLRKGDYILRTIKSVSNILNFGNVYDISVDSDSHLFCCGYIPIMTHNSWDVYCLSDDSEILTDNGWRNIDTISKDDKAATLNIDKWEMEFCNIDEIIKSNYSGDMYEIETANISQLITPNHRMLHKYVTHSGNKRIIKDYQYTKADELIPKDGSLIPVSAPYKEGTWELGYVKASLIGWILTDSHYLEKCDGVYIYQSAKKYHVDIRELLTESGMNFTEKFESKTMYKIADKEYPDGLLVEMYNFYISAKSTKWIKEIIPNRRPTEELLNLTYDDRMSIFIAMIKGDGSFKHTAYCFYSQDKEKRDWFQRLALSLGFQAKINDESGCVNVSNRKEASFNRTYFVDGKLPIRKYDGRIWCIRNRNTNFFMRRNDKISVTGNSGFPCNMGGFTLLNEYIAGELDINSGPLSFSCKSLHAYSHHVDIIAQRLNK